MTIDRLTKEDIDSLYDAYIATDEGRYMHDILLCMDRGCGVWMHRNDIANLKKKILVQTIELFTKNRPTEFEESTEPYLRLE